MQRTKLNKTQVNNSIGKKVVDIQTLSALVARQNLFSKLGSQYGGDRDLYQALGYKITLTWNDYYAQYTRQDIAKAIIDRPASATWRGELRVFESKDAEETEFEKAWTDLEKRLALKAQFKRLDKLTCLGEYAVLLLGFDDISETNLLYKKVGKKAKLIYVKPVSQPVAEVHTWVKDTKDSRYGLPLTYKIALADPGQTGNAGTTVTVHYSRVIHITYDRLESEVLGTPVLKAVFNRLMDIEKLVGGSAEMFWRGARPGYHGKVDPDYQMTDDMEDTLKDQLDEFEHNLRRVLVNEGVEMKALDSQISDPQSHVDIQIQMISAETGIPKRILTGTERGELSSSQDEDTWLSLIKSRREDFAEPMILIPFINRCVEYGVLPKPKTDEWTVLWSDLFAKSEKDQAEVGRIRATALREYTLNPYAVEVVPPEAFFEYFLGLTPQKINHIRDMEKEAITLEISETPEEIAIRKAEEKKTRSQKTMTR